MADEDEKFRAYLAEHGYDVSLLGLPNESGSVDEIEKTPTEDEIKLPVA